MDTMETFYEVMRRQGISKRSFLKYCSLTATSLGLAPSFVPQDSLSCRHPQPVAQQARRKNAGSHEDKNRRQRTRRQTAKSFQLSDVAMEKLATLSPDCMERISGSLPRLPTRMTLFTLPAIVTSFFNDSADYSRVL